MTIVNEIKAEKRAKAADARAAKAAAQAEWRGYINVQLSAEEKAEFDDWMHLEEPWDRLTEAVENGCVVSLKKDGSSSAFLCSITQRTEGHVNAGLSITARSKEAGKALFRAVFLVARLGVQENWEQAAPLADDDRW